MPIEQISAQAALSKGRKETLRSKWPDERFPAERREGVIEVYCSPSFEIRPDDKIFTMGSCFARNIEKRLHAIGLNTVLYDPELIAGLEVRGELPPFLNKYNISSMRTEIEWACGEAVPPEDHVL